jgi:ABC-type transporter Mla MlaB component
MTPTISLPAELNIYAVTDVWRTIGAALPAAGSRDTLTIDCDPLREIDAAGVQLLLSLAGTASQRAIGLVFESMPELLTSRLQAIGASHLLAPHHRTEVRGE